MTGTTAASAAATEAAGEGRRSRARLWAEIWGLLKEFWKAQPLASLALAVLLVVGNSRTALYVLAMGGLVDALVSGTSGGHSAVFWVGVYIAGRALEEVYWPLKNFISDYLLDHGTYRVQRTVLERAAAAPLIQFEEGEFFDHLQRAASGTGERLVAVYQGTVDLFQVLFMLGGTALALYVVHPALLPLLVISAVPALWLQTRTVLIGYQIHRQHTTRDRIRSHLERLLTGREAAGEIRLFGTARYLLARWLQLREERMRDVFAGDRRRALLTTTGGLFSGAAYAAALVLVAILILRGQVTIGGYAAVATGALWFQDILASVINVLTMLEEQSQFLGDLFDFRRAARGEAAPSGEVPAPSAAKGPLSPAARGLAVEAERLTFSYPGGAQPVLREITLRVGRGERIAIIGENGAGKTTLVKLLIGLYQPDEGLVRLDGERLTEGRVPEARRRIAAVFQDYAAYQLSARENIGFGDVRRLEDTAALASAAGRAAIAAHLESLPKGYDAYLGRQFGETELSGGQWQRVALARAFFRNADLLVLDEPTAALDPLAELALFERFVELTDGRTAIMISHRLGAARLADRVIVLRDGRIVEQGHHDSLVHQGGEYARLFAAQARWYRPSVG